jgi:hypothetical protein
VNLTVVPPNAEAAPEPRKRKARCWLCGPAGVEVNGLLAEGMPAAHIERKLRAEGRPIKAETIRRHVVDHVESEALEMVKAASAQVAASRVKAVKRGDVDANADFAALVHARATADLNDDILRVTTKDGLAAAAILDRRAEKSEERKFMLNLAQLLSGGGARAPEQLGEGAIEGEFSEVENKLLAPPELRGDLT